MDDKLDLLIKKYLESATPVNSATRFANGYPGAGDLYRFMTDELKGEELNKLLNHLKEDEELQVWVRHTREILNNEKASEEELVPEALKQSVKSLMPKKTASAACPHCGKPITPFKKPLSLQRWSALLWGSVAIAAFVASFIFRWYFMQCLAVAVLAGFKCLLDMRSTKTQILIYKALSEQDTQEQHRLHRSSSRL